MQRQYIDRHLRSDMYYIVVLGGQFGSHNRMLLVLFFLCVCEEAVDCLAEDCVVFGTLRGCVIGTVDQLLDFSVLL